MMGNCDCECKGVEKYIPVRIYNPAGLSSISYRVGTHGRFKAQMVSEISSEPALAKLTTRSDSDLSIAFLDSWATIADVLAFYQERIANEGFLQTATERRSVLELARSIGYELRPGVAASTYLAFKMDASPGSPEKITIEAGTKVQSIPGKDEMPQVFETSEDIEARQEWNEIKPRQVKKQEAATALAGGQAFFEGTATKLRAGDGLLFVVDGSPIGFRIVKEIEIDAKNQQTRVTFDTGTGASAAPQRFIGDDTIIDADTDFIGDDLEEILEDTWTESAFEAKSKLEGWSIDVIVDAVNSRGEEEEEADNGIYAFRIKCGVFGQNVPYYYGLPAIQRKGGTIDGISTEAIYPLDWDKDGGVDIHTDTHVEPPTNGSAVSSFGPYEDADIYLDNVYQTIQTASWLILDNSRTSHVYKVSATSEKSMMGFSLTSRVIGLKLERKPLVGEILSKDSDGTYNLDLETFKFRDTTVYAQPEKLILADMPVDGETIEGDKIVLEKMIGWLQEGQPLLVEGELADQPGITRREIALIENVIHFETDRLTTIKLSSSSPLKYVYKRATVTIDANVAKATHGQTKEEAIGSGDPSQRFQSFELKQGPLTFVPDSSSSGTKNTLEIKMDAVTWKEATSFEELSESDSAYITRTSNDAKTSVIFGDGTNGRLPPSGSENIKARYRVGIGTDGLLDADKLTLLMKRPLGVKSVTNPLAATGAADPEELGDARKNAPRTVLTLDRIVSLEDFADFARGFAGVGKATAYEIDYGGGRAVLVAIASSEGTMVNDSDELCTTLQEAIENYKDPTAVFLLRSYNKMAFNVGAKILVSGDREFEDVKQNVEHALNEAFSFGSRDFGQAVTLSEVISVIQGVEGVDAVDIESLYEHDPSSMSVPEEPERMIRAAGVEQGGVVIPSLLLVNEEGITVEEMSA